jgi:two-component system, response regulator YesN
LYKLLIVDDEAIVRKGLARIVELSESGFEVAGEAGNGSEGVELAEKLNPELIIADIKMPEMNGLEMIDKLKKTRPEIKFIILSAYTDFDYTRHAIQSGVADYLKKPVNRHELAALLDQIKLDIDQEKEALKQKEQLSEFSQELGAVREKFLDGLLNGADFPPEQLQRKLEAFQIGTGIVSNCFCLIIRIDNYYSLGFQGRKEIEDFRSRIFESCKDMLTGPWKAELFFRKENELIGAVFLTRGQGAVPGEILDSLPKILSVPSGERNYSVTIGVGDVYDSVVKLHHSYNDANRALKAGFYTGNGKIYFSPDIRGFEKFDYQVLLEKQKQLLDNLVVNIMAGNAKAELILEEILAAFSKRDLLPEVVVKFGSSVLEYLTWNLKRNGYGISVLEPDLAGSETFDGLKTNITRYIAEIMTEITTLQAKGERRVVEIAKEYIISNYASELGLETVARYVHMNPNYFSSLFKKETGKNYIDFVTEIRIEKAKELLHQIDLKIYDICQMVGYYSPKHFSRLFKQIVGMTPLDYRSKIK